MTVPVQVRTTPPEPEDVRAQYGFVALIAEQIPEIGTLMKQAVEGNWTSDRFSLALANTNWWKVTPDGQRQWLVKAMTDPASAEVEAATGADQMGSLAAQLGLPTLSPVELKDVWLWSKVAGYDENGTRAFLSRKAFELGEGGEANGGRYGQVVNEMFKSALDYGYASPGLLNEITEQARWMMTYTGGAVDTTGWKSKMMQFAAAKYQPFAERLKGGETLTDIARPYMDSYTRVLELNPNSVSLASDQMLQRALQGDGQKAKTVWEFEQDLRKDERWGNTDNAKDSASKTLTSIGKAFGMIG